MSQDLTVAVGTIARAHGVYGEVAVYVTTDEPEDRFVVGSALQTDPATAGPLRIETMRVHTSSGGNRLLIGFEGVADRDAAERLRGVKLLVAAKDIAPTGDPDTFHDFQLVGLGVHLDDGEKVGEIVRVTHGPGADMLVVARDGGRRSLIPFVTAIVPDVDLAAGRVTITPPEGLLDL